MGTQAGGDLPSSPSGAAALRAGPAADRARPWNGENLTHPLDCAAMVQAVARSPRYPSQIVTIAGLFHRTKRVDPAPLHP